MDLFGNSIEQALQLLESRTGGTMPGELRSARIDAANRFIATGLPTIRDEDWKYTNLSPLLKRTFQITGEADADALVADAFLATGLAAECRNRAVLANGIFRPGLSKLDSLPHGLEVCGAGSGSAAGREALANALQRTYERDSAMTDLNTAFLHDAVVITVDEGVAIREPLHVVCVGVGGASAVMRLPRVIIQAGRNSSMTVVEEYISAGADLGLTNSVTEITLGEGSSVHHHRLQNEALDASHIGRVYVDAASHSRFLSDSVSFGAGLARVDIDVALREAGASCRLNGLFVAGGNQHVDHHTRIDHEVGNTHSEELYRGILDERSRGVFNGKVIVHRDAQQISARQTSNNLLLSRYAEIDTKPELEIYADDVACAHGATVGELDIDALFYLRSRGMSENDARALLIYAFAEQVIENIPVEGVRRWIENRFIAGGGYRDLMEALKAS